MNKRIMRYREELSKLYERRNNINTRISKLEKKCTEAENTEIHEMTRAADLSPEELAELIKISKTKEFIDMVNGQHYMIEGSDEERMNKDAELLLNVANKVFSSTDNAMKVGGLDNE